MPGSWNRNPKRSESGVSLTELLIGTLLMGVTLAVLAEFMAGLTTASAKLTNQFDAQLVLRNAITRIRADVRAARSIGDCYSTVPSNTFPGPGNWLYQTPPSGGWPIDWGSTPYQLNAQTLVLQVPAVHDGITGDGLNGFPLKISSQTLVNGMPAPSDMEDLDTIVYKVIQDPTNSSVASLQVAVFPGFAHAGKGINPPQTLVRGIIGPKTGSGTGIPDVFSYLEKNPAFQTNKNPTDPSKINGVRIDLEVRRPISSAEGSSKFQKNASAHAEVFSRWNRM